MELQHNETYEFCFSKISGSLTPFELYKHITNSRNNPDLVAISILSEIIYWYRANQSKKTYQKFSDDAWCTSYKHFESKFSYNKEKIRRAFVRLEERDLIAREYRNVIRFGRTYNNVLFIHLNIPKVLNILGLENNKKFSNFGHQIETTSPQNSADIYIENKNNKEISRSKDLSENENFDEEGLEDNSEFKNIQQPSIKKQEKINITTKKKLSEYLPLDEAIYKEILSKTQREFSVEFVTILLKKLSEKYELHSFIDDSYFIKYMTKVLDNELLSEEEANNKEYKKENEYLATIEDSVDTSRVGRLKRRIVSMFDCKTAYRLLTEYDFSEKYEERNFEYKISLKKEKNVKDKNGKEQGQDIILSEYYRDLLLREVRNIFGNYVSRVDIGSRKKGREHSEMKSAKKDFMVRSSCNKSKQNNQTIVEETQKSGIWGRARNILIKKYGIEVDQAWFKKLEMTNIEEGREVILQAPTMFIRDWVKNNYLREIEKTISELVPSIEMCTVNVGMY